MDSVKKLGNLNASCLALVFALLALSGGAIAGEEGCVSCHAGPMALNTLVPARVENHPDISAMVNTVPTDCTMCHAKGSPMALMNIAHNAHQGVTCDNCHVVDESGVPSALKSGAKNW